jgi:hypothetical protein
MKIINLCSFICAIICVFLFFIVSFSNHVDYAFFGFYPLNIVLYLTLLTLILGVVGFAGVQDWKGMIRSLSTVIISGGLSALLTIIILFGSLLG